MPGRSAAIGASDLFIAVLIVLVVVLGIELLYRIDETAAIGAFPLVIRPVSEIVRIEIGRVDVFGAHRGIGFSPIRFGQRQHEFRFRERGFRRRERRRPVRGDEGRFGLSIACLHAIEQCLEILRDGGDGVRGLVELLCLAVQPREHGHRQAIVEAVTRNDLVAALHRFGAAVHGAREQLVRQPLARMTERGGPAEREQRAGLALTQRIGARGAHPRSATGILHGAAFGEGFEEDALAFGRPAIVALGFRAGRMRCDGLGHVPEGGTGVPIMEGGGVEANEVFRPRASELSFRFYSRDHSNDEQQLKATIRFILQIKPILDSYIV